MIRTFGSSVIIAIAIAVGLSLLPSIEVSPEQEVSVFQRDNPAVLTEQTLVDFLALQQTVFPYRRAEWDGERSVLTVEFTSDKKPTEARIGREWFQFARSVFQKTSNVDSLKCRLYSEGPQGALWAELTADRRILEAPDLNHTDAIDFLNHRFDFRVRID